MFESARLKLTAWYLLILMMITGLFSAVFYHTSTREIQRLINRIEVAEKLEAAGLPNKVALLPPDFPTLEELRQLKRRSFMSLAMINGLILLLAGVASYFLAGETLKPIQQMVDEQNDFVSNASHELRTPLATLRAEMEASLLEKKLTDRNARTLIKSNLEEVISLQELTERLLRQTYVHDVGQHHELETVELATLIKAAHKKVVALANSKKIKIETKTIPAKIKVTAAEVIEAFVILLDNAIKYSQPKTIITISTQKTTSHVITSITDQGVGIDSADLPHIFERFYRADHSRSQAEGYGLGLAIAQQNIENQGGMIEVLSQVGVGSTFTIRLPLTK